VRVGRQQPPGRGGQEHDRQRAGSVHRRRARRQVRPAGTLYVDLAELPAGVTASDGVQYLQLALTWAGADQSATREWAERFAGQLGDL
jgi:hypothetical protein